MCSITIKQLAELEQRRKQSLSLLNNDNLSGAISIWDDVTQPYMRQYYLIERFLLQSNYSDELLSCSEIENLLEILDITVDNQANNLLSKLLHLINFNLVGHNRFKCINKLADKYRYQLNQLNIPLWIKALIKARLLFAQENFEAREEIRADFATISNVDNKMINFISQALKRMADVDYPSTAGEKVFCIGLSRTGTSSLNDALTTLGYSSVHWHNPITSNILRESDYFFFDAFSDITVTAEFETLFYQFPNSKFIYTKRNPKDWEHSISTHYYRQHRVRSIKELDSAKFRNRLSGRAWKSESSLYTNYDCWQSAYKAHDQRVNHFFSGLAKDRLLTLDIEKGLTWSSLCSYLGRDVPNIAFPHANKTSCL